MQRPFLVELADTVHIVNVTAAVFCDTQLSLDPTLADGTHQLSILALLVVRITQHSLYAWRSGRSLAHRSAALLGYYCSAR